MRIVVDTKKGPVVFRSHIKASEYLPNLSKAQRQYMQDTAEADLESAVRKSKALGISRSELINKVTTHYDDQAE